MRYLISSSVYLEQSIEEVTSLNLQVSHQSLGQSVFGTNLIGYCVNGSQVSTILNLQDTMSLEKA